MTDEAQSDKKTTGWAQMMEDASDNEEEGKYEGSHPASRKNSESQVSRETREHRPKGDFIQNMLKTLEITPPPITIFVYNLPPKATEEDVRRLYSDIDITSCVEWRKGAFTLEINDKDEAVKLVKGPRKFFQRMPVKIRLPMKREEGDEGLREKNQQKRTEYNSGRKYNDYQPRNGRPNFDRKRDHQEDLESEGKPRENYGGGGQGFRQNQKFNNKNQDRPYYKRPQQQNSEEASADQPGPLVERKPMGFFKKETNQNEKKDDGQKEVVAKPNPFGQAKPRDVAVIARTEAEVEKIMEVEGLKPHAAHQEHRDLKGGSENPKHNHDHKPHHEQRSHHDNKAHHEQRTHHEKQPEDSKAHQSFNKQEQNVGENKREETQQKSKPVQREEKPNSYHNNQRPQTGNSQRNADDHRPKYTQKNNQYQETQKAKDPTVDDDGFKTVVRRQPVEEKKSYNHKDSGYKVYNKNKEGQNNFKNERRGDRGEKNAVPEGEKKKEENTKAVESKTQDQKKKVQPPTQNKYGNLGNEEDETND